MHETWSLIRDITEVLGLFLMPLMAWVMWSLINHGKQIIVLEQKVNDSLNQRLGGIEQRVGGLETKIDELGESVTESSLACRMVVHDNNSLHDRINQKFDTLISKLDNIER